MFGFFKKKQTTHTPVLADLNNNPISEGDIVQSLRYDLGKCRVIATDKGLAYESMENGKQVSWHLMVDASTDLQKVQKVVQEPMNNGQ
ncbi:hypothetical protein [Tunicatimonas pelagia]|uniref:hypothetical protein n=1 Tax=Tunicatimonas pelagia TaxID=931531 RepID=UPI002665DE59|nr:hypothetical protein [Tunicatimonas pelagia]WKN41312.1 hypothetical protein P0M28_19950 [Tunicatimonas pelagia]